MIYFITDGMNVKIGTAVNVANRLRQMKAANPHRLTLLAQCEGDLGIERAIHQLGFRRLPASEEWYFPAPSLLRFIDRVRKDGLPAVLRRVHAKQRSIKIARGKAERAGERFTADLRHLIADLVKQHGTAKLATMVGVTKATIRLNKQGKAQMTALNLARLGVHHPQEVKALMEGRLVA